MFSGFLFRFDIANASLSNTAAATMWSLYFQSVYRIYSDILSFWFRELISVVSFWQDGWHKRWVKSDWKRSEGKAGSFKHTAGKWSGDPDDKGASSLLSLIISSWMVLSSYNSVIMLLKA